MPAKNNSSWLFGSTAIEYKTIKRYYVFLDVSK